MGCKIKERREFLKMSQEELAEKSAVSRATISSLENNSERNTSTKILKRIASALDTTVGELFLQMMSKGLDTSSKTISLEGGKTWTTQQGREGISRPTICCRSPLAFTVVATAGIQLEASMPKVTGGLFSLIFARHLATKTPITKAKKSIRRKSAS